MAQIIPWRRLRASIMALRETGAIVLDATSLLGQSSCGEFDGTYLPKYSDDQIHPNDHGHAALAIELTRIIEKLCGLSR